MLQPRKIKAIKMTAVLLSALLSYGAQAQKVYRNQYPCGDCAVFDNNGHDLMSFIHNYKNDLDTRGSKVNSYGNGNWGYLLVGTGRVPSVTASGPRKGELNYYEYITSTFALYKTADGGQATWWGREANAENGPLTSPKAHENNKLEMEHVRYTQIMSQLAPRHFTLVEYADTNYNEHDYNVLLKNYILTELGSVKNPDDYRQVIDFFNGFLGQFTYVDDPILEKKAFITLLAIGETKYIGYFNIVNGKLAGHLDVLNLQFEADKDAIIARVMKKLGNATRTYVYADNVFDMEKAFSRYARANKVKIRPWKTTSAIKFNADK